MINLEGCQKQHPPIFPRSSRLCVKCQTGILLRGEIRSMSEHTGWLENKKPVVTDVWLQTENQNKPERATHKPRTKHSCRHHSLLLQSNNWDKAEEQLTVIIANNIPRPTFILMYNWERIRMYVRFITLPIKVITAIESRSYRCLALQNHFKINTVWHIMPFIPTWRLRFLYIQYDKDFGSNLYLILILQKIGC